MNQYQIISSSNVFLGEYLGETPQEALDAMARSAGYASQADAVAKGIEPFSGRIVAASYRYVVGEKGNEQGHVSEEYPNALECHNALQACLEGYGSDGWGRIEWTSEEREGWDRLDPQ